MAYSDFIAVIFLKQSEMTLPPSVFLLYYASDLPTSFFLLVAAVTPVERALPFLRSEVVNFSIFWCVTSIQGFKKTFIESFSNDFGRQRASVRKPLNTSIWLAGTWQVRGYATVIKEAMDLSPVLSKIDSPQYLSAGDFLKDIDLICNNALEYNPDQRPAGEDVLFMPSLKNLSDV